jgi:hypothetical protein
MKKLCCLGAVLLLSSTAELTAQTTAPLKIGFGLSNGFLVQDPNGYALGGDFKIKKNITNRVAITASAGFNHYFFSAGETHLDTEGPSKAIPWNSIPLKAGVRAFVNDHVYVAGETIQDGN